MKKTKSENNFVLCVKNEGYPASLELGKVYPLLEDKKGGKVDFLRIIDESGEDYLYPKGFFVAIEVPIQARGIFPVAG